MSDELEAIDRALWVWVGAVSWEEAVELAYDHSGNLDFSGASRTDEFSDEPFPYQQPFPKEASGPGFYCLRIVRRGFRRPGADSDVDADYFVDPDRVEATCEASVDFSSPGFECWRASQALDGALEPSLPTGGPKPRL